MTKSKFKLDPLPYGYSSLEPSMSEETLILHHDRHHQKYVDKLNELLPGSGFEDASLEDIVRGATDALFNQAGQHWNHRFFWQCLTPESSLRPKQHVQRAIEKTFQSFDTFQAEFEKQGNAVFGSGWVWLVQNQQNQLLITTTKDGDCPIRSGLTPLLVCDVWEHAYYVDYQNNRAQFLTEFWNIVNWDHVETCLVKGNPQQMAHPMNIVHSPH